MSQNVQTFSDPKQREAIVTDMLLGVIKTGKMYFLIYCSKYTVTSNKSKHYDSLPLR